MEHDCLGEQNSLTRSWNSQKWVPLLLPKFYFKKSNKCRILGIAGSWCQLLQVHVVFQDLCASYRGSESNAFHETSVFYILLS
jgi:hypothetical protein